MTRFQSALITGASSGIGAALAWELARRGTHLALIARRTDRLAELAAALEREFPGVGRPRAQALVLDVCEHGLVRQAIRKFDAECGGLDLLVANAGIARGKPAQSLSLEDLLAPLEVNLVAAAASLHAGLECFLTRGRGTLCGISSLASFGGFPASGSYSASKAGLAALLETWRLDLAGTGITVVDVQPGFVESEMTRGPAADARIRARRMVPVERAAVSIAEGLERGRAVVSFPWQESLPIRILDALPRPLWRAAMAVLSPRNKPR